MSENLLMESFNYTLIGMGTVFMFLILMIVIMYIMSALVQKLEQYFPQETAKPAAVGTDNALVAIAIAAAKRFQGK